MSIANQTRTLTVNAAFLQEIKETNECLWNLLDRIRDRLQDASELRAQFAECVEGLGELRDELALHFALEEAYGYFEDPVSVEPLLSERALLLRAEHGPLYESLAELVENGERIRRHGMSFSEMSNFAAEFFRFDHALREHEQLEIELILEESDVDIGSGD